MGTILLHLIKWETLSGDLGGYFSNTRESCTVGWRASAWSRRCTAPTRCGEPKQRRSIARPVTSVPSSCCSAIQSWRAQCGTSASKSTTLWKWPSRSICSHSYSAAVTARWLRPPGARSGLFRLPFVHLVRNVVLSIDATREMVNSLTFSTGGFRDRSSSFPFLCNGVGRHVRVGEDKNHGEIAESFKTTSRPCSAGHRHIFRPRDNRSLSLDGDP